MSFFLRACLELVGALALVGVGIAIGFTLRGPADAPATGWRDVSRLDAARSHFAAAALLTGEVLVVGGLDPVREVVLGTAELVDPVSGAVRETGVRIARIDPTLTALASGSVLVVGGSARAGEGWAQVAVADLYDPLTQRWRRARSLHEGRADHGATLLLDGRVLVVGGQRQGRMLASAEIYEPARDRWTRAAPLPRRRAQFSIATLPDGRVLVAGGLEGIGLPSKTSAIYDPRADAWTAGPDLSLERVLHTTARLGNGDVLLIGGQRAAAGSAERFDHRLGRWVFSGTLAQPRMLALATTLRDGRVLVVGGLPRPGRGGDHFDPTESSEVYDPATNLFSSGPAVEDGVAFGGLVTTFEGTFLLGGSSEDERAVDRVLRLR